MINKINPLIYRFWGCFIKKVTEIVVIFENGKADPHFYGIGLFFCNVSPNKSMWLFCCSLETNLCLMFSFCRGNEKNHPSHRVISAKGGFFSNYAPKKAIFFRDKLEFQRGRLLPIASFYPILIGVQQPFVSLLKLKTKKIGDCKLLSAIAILLLLSRYCNSLCDATFEVEVQSIIVPYHDYVHE